MYMAPTNGFGPLRRGDWSFDTGNDSPVNGSADAIEAEFGFKEEADYAWG